MARPSRTRSAVVGRQRARAAANSLGDEIRASRLRRNLTQLSLAAKTGVSRSQIAKVETGRGHGVRAAEWFALADALGRFLRFEFARDPLEAPADAGHLDIQQLVLRTAQQAGFDDRRVEMPGRTGNRWTDVAIVQRSARVLVLIECVNTFGDVGAGFRSGDRKLADARDLAVALAGDGTPFEVGSCWVVRDSARNRELVARYRQLFESRFPGSSIGWVLSLTKGEPLPTEPGLVWCDSRATRLFAWRRRTPR
jgi:transcriptional regulator with XRE-family HTH domain